MSKEPGGFILDDDIIEKLVIKTYLKESDFFEIINQHVKDEYFENETYKNLFKAIRNYIKKYEKIPNKSILYLIGEKLAKSTEQNPSLIKKEIDYILELNIDSSFEFLKDNILKFIRSKKVYYTILENIDNIKQYGDVGKCIKEFENIFNISIDNKLGFDFFEDYKDFLDYIKNPELRVSTGFKQLDKVTNGGFLKEGKSIYVFVAPPGIGKSLMFSNLALNFAKQGMMSVIFSMEMSEMIYANRIAAHISKYDINRLGSIIDLVEKNILEFRNKHNTGRIIIKEYPPRSISCMTFKNFIEKLERKYERKIDAIFIDYLGLVNPISGISGKNSYERVGEVSKESRALSYIFSAPVITAQQVNREGFNNSDADLDNVSDSAQIAHDADFFATLWQVDGDREANRLNSTIRKNRLGIIGKVLTYYIDYNDLTLSDYDEAVESSDSTNLNENVTENPSNSQSVNDIADFLNT